MRLRRFRLRTLMIVVVLAALGLTCGLRLEWDRRRARYLRQAAHHGMLWASIREFRNQSTGRTEIWARHDPVRKRWIVTSSARKDYESRMSRKYREAAGSPWRPVPPDRPPPR